MKYLIFLSLATLCSSCAYLAEHPQVEADLKKEGVDVARDTEQVVVDVIDTASKADKPAAPSGAGLP